MDSAQRSQCIPKVRKHSDPPLTLLLYALQHPALGGQRTLLLTQRIRTMRPALGPCPWLCADGTLVGGLAPDK